jgi:predicted molibdopterin-dependent oxidoreductase YjgC
MENGMRYKSVLTTCPYCAVGCNMFLQVLDNDIIATLPAKTGPTNEGRLCIKGWRVHEFIQNKERLVTPYIRRNGELVACSWEESLSTAASELNRLKTDYGPESVVFVGSARCTNEETYIFQKFARAVFGHNHIDHCARL